jgi:hypothetical protein
MKNFTFFRFTLAKSLLSVFILSLLFFCGLSFGQTADFNNTFAVLSIDGGVNSFYDLKAVTANPDFQGNNLGSFSASNTLVLKGAQHNVYKCGGCDLSSTRLYYRVYKNATTPGAFQIMTIGYLSGASNGCGGEDQIWEDQSGTTNVLQGLNAGNYTFEMYSDATISCSGGTAFASNSGANYKANFSYCGATSGALASGNYAIPGCFATVASAISYINTNGITGTGPVQFDVAAGYTETAPAGGFSITATGTATNTITFIKSGAGVNPTINAGIGTATPASAAPDGIFSIRGGDFITIDGFTFTDGNTTNPATMEFGIGFFKASAGNGCNNNTVQNCVINMQRVNNAASTAPMIEGAVGILVINSTAIAATTVLTPTNGGTLATNGTNSANKFYKNTINSGNYGIGLSGFAASTGVGPTPTATTFLGDLGNDIGGVASGTGNTILNFGGGAATNVAAGIRVNNQWSINISFNTIDNNNGSGVNHATTLRGIYAQAGTSGAATINNNSVTVRSGATTSGLTAIDNAIGSTAVSSNTININNNTIRFSYTTATTGVFTAISNTATAGMVNVSSNSIQQIAASNYPTTGTVVVISGSAPGGPLNITNNTISNFVMTGASGTLRAINATTPTGLYSITGNTIENLSYTTTTSTGSITGIYNFLSATLQNINSNIVRNFSTPTTGTLNGIQNNTVGGTFQVRNNQIYNFSTTAGGVGGFSANGITWSNATADISGNIIYAINSTGTTGGTSGTINGITHSGAATVTGNAIYDLSSNSTNVVITGITTSATGTNTVSNNLIGDLRAPNSTANIAISGMLISGGTTNNIFHNTVNIAATTTSATTFGTSAIYFSSSTPVNNLRNNIFVNTSTPGLTGGFAAAIRYTAAPTSVNFPAANNNNFYYAGTPAANKLIYGETATATSTNGQQTIANYKTYINTTLPVSGRESNSVSEVPNFVSTTGSNPITNFLKYDTSIATQIEQGGVTGTGIATDYALTSRCPAGGCPGAAATPDMGAWEQNGLASDLSGPTISYTALTNDVFAPSRTFSGVTITDASGVNGTAGTRPRVYYKKTTDANEFNDNTQGSAGWKYAEANGSTSPFDFTINYSLLSGGTGVVASDVIQYFVVGQDNAGTPNVGINSGTFTGTPTNVNLAGNFPIGGSINTYSITASISGTITVPGTYPSLTLAGGAFEAINNATVTGNINIEITSDLLSENGDIALNQFASPHIVKIYPTGAARIVSGSLASNALIKLNGADRVNIDGSVGGIGTDRSLTITNTATTAPTVISLISLGTGLGATNNTVKNCNISTGVQSTTGYGIAVGGSTPGTTGADNDNTTIQNNNITNCAVGIYAIGTAAVIAGGDDNLNITGNIIDYNGVITTPISIRVGNILNSSISQNTIDVETTALSAAGISLETGANNTVVSRNLIRKVRSTNTVSSSYPRGIVVGTGQTGSAITLSNNVIYNVIANFPSSTVGFNHAGIVIGAIGTSTTMSTVTGGVNLYFNSVNISGNSDRSIASLCMGVHFGSAVSSIDLRNNIFANSSVNINAGATAAKSYAIYSQSANTAFTTINNNDYFVSGTQGLLGFITSDRADLSAIQAGFGQNINSVNTNPLFTSSTDLTINSGLTAIATESSAATGTGITVDFSGATRPVAGVNGGGTAPDMGAYEFDGVPLSPCATPASQPTALILNATGQTTASGSYSAASPGATNYLVIRTTSNTLTNTPANMTTYSVGANVFFGTDGFVQSNGTGLTFSSTGLASNTTYYYWVFSYNTGNCNGGPLYLTTAPLSGSVLTGALFTSIASGNWEDGTTWNQSGNIPTAASDVIISNTNTVSVIATNAVAASVVVNSTGALNVTGSTLSVVGTSGSGITNGGTLTVGGGILNLGPVDNSFANRLFTNNGTLTVNTGTLFIAGRLLVNNSSVFNQAGGDINIDGNAGGVAANSVAASTAIISLNPSTLTSVNLTGGTLTIVDPHASTTASNVLTVIGGTNGPLNVTAGHTIRFGNGTSTDAGGNAVNGFTFDTWNTTTGMPFGNVVIAGPTGTNRFVTSTYQQPVSGNVTVNNGGESRIATLYINGNLTVNSGGIFTSTTSLSLTNSTFVDNSTVSFSASTNAQLISGAGTFRNLTASPTAKFTSVTLNNSSTVTFGDPNLTVSANLTVSGTTNHVVSTGSTYSIAGIVTIASTANLTFSNDSYLIQTPTTTTNSNVGSVKVNRNSSPMVLLDYTAWSSPVIGQNLKTFSPATLDNRFYTYDPVANAYVVVATPASTNFTSGVGYLLRAPNDSNPSISAAYAGQFAGVPFNGTRTTAVTTGFNLVGNPYPSKLDALNFLANATNTGLGITTLHFWTHTVAAVGGVYPTNNYASFNAIGGTAAAAGGATPNGTISVGQGFFVNPTTAGNATFLNTMRSATASTQFFKSSSIVNTPSDKHRFWLNLTTPTTANNQILIGYVADASNDFDAKYDAPLFGNTASVIYSKVADYKLAIQGRSSFAITDVLPLGLQATEAGQFTISLADFDGLFVNQNIFLKDNVLNTIQNLKLGSYTFNATQGEFASRFEVVFDSSLLSTNSNVFNDASVIVIKNNNGMSIETGNNTIEKVAIYDIRGRLLLTKTNVNASIITLNNVATANQVLIVKITNTNNQTVTKKVVN